MASYKVHFPPNPLSLRKHRNVTENKINVQSCSKLCAASFIFCERQEDHGGVVPARAHMQPGPRARPPCTLRCIAHPEHIIQRPGVEVISKIWAQKVRTRSHHSVIVIIINYSASAYKLDHKYDYAQGIKSGGTQSFQKGSAAARRISH
jgi:hypothetical protein